jgi:peptidoglycan/LPS O-acetylase OafA/YrhL
MENRYMPALNGLRGWAFLNVLLEHNFIYLNSIAIAQPAVAMFYVLSGYLLSLQLYTKLMKTGKMNIINYAIRRFFRIYPCFILAILFDYNTGRIDYKQFVKLALFCEIFKQFWTIFYETRAYIVIPILVYIIFCLKRTLLKFIFIGISVVAFCIWFASFTFTSDPSKMIVMTNFVANAANLDYLTKNIGFLYFLPIFCLGVFAGVINYHIKVSKIQFTKWYIGILSLFLATAHVIFVLYLGLRLILKQPMWFQHNRDNLNLFFSIGYAVLAILLSGESSNFCKRIFESRVFIFLGDISYPGYLFHLSINYYFMWKAQLLDPHKNIYVFTCVTITTLFIFSFVLHKTVENFFIRKTKNFCLPSDSQKASEGKTYVTLPNVKTEEQQSDNNISVDPKSSNV